MNQADAIDIVQEAIWTIITACAPAVAAAMIVGIVIALFQALTQIQEMTLTFVPKILAIFVVIAITASFTGAQVYAFTQEAYGRIETGFDVTP
ncbi:flagellar biosynthesis protein Q [Fulvimarina pelagi HTCC2506]|uniref:Flagellar biosynthetic protein FliQ n=2 Tax=Fulvimarina pelagi TaxID=217511 RepID=Q0G1E4_9HYPH|nr:flagellar biosynthesis protein FliQ [Fulvimarina pelagi]EAU41137.1 flagellar biosynthesis protein Q [Fulvimarina pelagi HTCC2506]BAT30848.1 flagellar biosynthesis protein FliQ [Fulvimarina pelagi]